MKTQKIKKQILGLILIFCFFLPVIALAQSPLSSSSTEGMKSMNDAFRDSAGYEANVKAPNVVALIIRLVLGVLGIIFLILIIMAGYQWMTAGGNEDQVKKSKDRMTNAVIGLIIVLAAYAITAFVFRNLDFFLGSRSTAI